MREFVKHEIQSSVLAIVRDKEGRFGLLPSTKFEAMTGFQP